MIWRILSLISSEMIIVNDIIKEIHCQLFKISYSDWFVSFLASLWAAQKLHLLTLSTFNLLFFCSFVLFSFCPLDLLTFSTSTF